MPDIPDAAWFAGRLRELREGAGLSRKDLAENAGLSVNAIRNLEQGVRRPAWETVLALSVSLGVDCTAFTRPPAEREPSGPGRPPKPKEETAPEKPKRSRRKKPGQ